MGDSCRQPPKNSFVMAKIRNPAECGRAYRRQWTRIADSAAVDSHDILPVAIVIDPKKGDRPALRQSVIFLDVLFLICLLSPSQLLLTGGLPSGIAQRRVTASFQSSRFL
jgi:hypothetical protein